MAGLAADSAVWVSPWKLFHTGIYEDWGELLLVAMFAALCIIWAIMDRRSELRLGVGVLALVIGAKMVMDGGPIAQRVTDVALSVPRAVARALR